MLIPLGDALSLLREQNGSFSGINLDSLILYSCMWVDWGFKDRCGCSANSLLIFSIIFVITSCSSTSDGLFNLPVCVCL